MEISPLMKSQRKLRLFGQSVMASKVERVVIDTNLWISFLITKNHKKLDSKIKSGKVKLLFSLELIEEFLTVANRTKFKRYFDKDDLEQLLDLFDVYGELVDIKSKVKIFAETQGTTFYCRWQKMPKRTTWSLVIKTC